jgi:hypothetical protein
METRLEKRASPPQLSFRYNLRNQRSKLAGTIDCYLRNHNPILAIRSDDLFGTWLFSLFLCRLLF